MKKKILFIILLLSIKIFGKEKMEDFSVILDWYPNAKHTFLYVGIENGYFKEEGINLKLHTPVNVSDGIVLTATKRANLAFYYMHKFIQMKSNENLPVISIGSITQKPLDVVIATKDKKIKRPKDLENKKIGHIGGLSEEILDSVITADGGDISKVELVNVGFDLLTATITKKVDATFGGLYTHEVLVLEDKGFDVDYFLTTDYGIPNYYETILIANKNIVEKEKNLYERFFRAAKKSFEYVKNNPEKSLEILVTNQDLKEFPLNKNIEKKSLELLIPIMEINGNFMSQDKDVWMETIDWMYNKKIINRRIEADDILVDIVPINL